jgi:hypothetical protein
MASERKPSIYSDRGTIGSSDELDEYGVWVKSEPQDLSSAGAENQETLEPPIPAVEELPDFDIDFGEESGFSGSGAAAEDFDTDSGGLAFDDASLDIPDLDMPEEAASPDTGSPDLGGGDALDFDDLAIPEESPEDLDGEEEFAEVPIEDFLGATSDNFEEAGLTLAAEDSDFEGSGGGSAAPADISTQLLMKIADELSSIRTELATLKKEFSVIREESPGDDKGEAQKKGFFDEEEDEKIALTGDELDNILNTADFTEEAGADATEELAGDFPPAEEDHTPSDPFPPAGETALPDLLSDEDDIIGGEPEEKNEEPSPAEVVDIELNLDQPDLDELKSGSAVQDQGAGLSFDSQEFDIDLESPPEAAVEPDDSEELRQLREEGAQPLTPVPEDTSYLDTETLDTNSEESAGEFSMDQVSLDEPALDESFDEPSIDLSEAVIDEPDLSGEITETPLEEPVLDDLVLDDLPEDLSVELDMEDETPDFSSEPLGAEDTALPEEELELSIPEEPDRETGIPAEEFTPPEEESFAQVIPEGFVVEADDSQVPFEDDPEEAAALSEGDIDTLEKNQEIEEETAAGEGGEDENFLSEDEELDIPSNIKQELRTVLSYMDQLLESLPEDKIEEFAKSEYFDTYKKLFKELGLV